MADNTDFFNQPGGGGEPDPILEEKIKIGDREFTQEDLGKRIGLSDLALETEQKYNTSINKIVPNLHQVINEKKALEERLKTLEQAGITRKTEIGQELSPEEQRKQALQQADDLGLIHTGNFQKQMLTFMEGYQLVSDAKGFVSKQETEGNPKTSVEDLLAYMNGQNPYNTKYGSLEKAYKDMFEPELDQLKEKKLQSLRPSGFVTSERSSAGSKQPTFPKPTKDNLDELVKAALRDSSFS